METKSLQQKDYRILDGKPEDKRPFARRRWEHNTKINLQKIEWKDID